MTATLTQRIAEYVCGEQFERLDPAVVGRTKQILTYHIGPVSYTHLTLPTKA